MRSSRLELGAALALVLSLALKLAVQDVAVDGDQQAAARDLKHLLAAEGYVAAIPRAEVPAVAARRGSCRFVARVLDPHGTFRDTELLKLPAGWQVRYFWRGGVSEALPRIGPLGEYYFARELVRVGLAGSRAPVVMLSLQPGCAVPRAEVLTLYEPLRRRAK